MRHFFLYDGVSSSHFRAWIAYGNFFDAPQRDVSEIEIPGRNGTLTIDNGRFSDMSITYRVYIPFGFPESVGELRAFLAATSGYRRLEDSIHPDEYRLAKYISAFTVENSDRNGGELDILFKCKPQRFLKSGEGLFSVKNGQRLYNPTNFPALPYFRVYGSSGRLMVGNTVIQISAINDYIEIDCDTQNAYKGTENCNANISHDFPALAAGETGIRWEGNITKVEMKARWWTV